MEQTLDGGGRRRKMPEVIKSILSFVFLNKEISLLKWKASHWIVWFSFFWKNTASYLVGRKRTKDC